MLRTTRVDRWTPLAGVLLFLVGAPVAGAPGPARPNILWILAEDMGPELGSYGYPGVRTPHLDRLAAEGFVHLTADESERFYRGTGKTDWNFSYDGRPFDSDRWADLAGHQPFYAQVNFPETHRGRDWDEAHLHIDEPADPARVEIPPYYPDHPETRADWAQYLDAVMALDKKVGFVLRRLEEDGLAERPWSSSWPTTDER